jgi:hypothetical protein
LLVFTNIYFIPARHICIVNLKKQNYANAKIYESGRPEFYWAIGVQFVNGKRNGFFQSAGGNGFGSGKVTEYRCF